MKELSAFQALLDELAPSGVEVSIQLSDEYDALEIVAQRDGSIAVELVDSDVMLVCDGEAIGVLLADSLDRAVERLA